MPTFADAVARFEGVKVAVAILLVGGFGTRLMPLTRNTPKPMC
jgi:UTP-glucose-1-phosphate uridylyltransferase